jgi:hypothetical protein
MGNIGEKVELKWRVLTKWKMNEISATCENAPHNFLKPCTTEATKNNGCACKVTIWFCQQTGFF